MIWSHQDCKSSQISSSKNTVVQRHTSSMGRNSSNWLYGPEPAQPAANASSRESSVDLFSPEAMLSGGAACMSHIIHHPLYTLKSQMMFHGHNFRFGSFLKQARSPTWLYSGMIQRMVGIMPEKAMKMEAWRIVGGYIEKQYPNAKYTKWLVAGGMAGVATTVVGCPSERAMVLAQIRNEGFVKVIRDTGLKGLYKGWTATLYRDILFNMTFFTTREIFVEQYTIIRGENPNPFQRIALGLIPGCLASIIGCPHDVVKTRMQGASLSAPYRSCSQLFYDIIQKEGARNLMKGLMPRLVAVPSMMSTFYVIDEELKKLFGYK